MRLSKPLRYTLFALLYFTQGTILSYFTALNALYLLERGLTMTNIGIFGSIALIPFVIKILFGMLSDRVNLFGMGHRKPYIFLGLAVQFACLIVVPFIDPKANYWGFVALAFVLQLGMALYDTCTDGLALDTTPEGEKGTIQAFMVGGRAVGVIVTASIVGLLAERSTWQAVFWLLAGLTLLPLFWLAWALPDQPLYRIAMPWVLLSGLIQLAAAGALLAGVKQTGALGFIGLRQALDPAGAGPLIAGRGADALVVRGLYRWVRHPLYTCGLVILWLTPVMSWNWLALAAGLTAYILIGIPFEERKLLAEFGAAYAEYQERTPALLPRVIRSHHGTLKGAGDAEGTEKKI